MWTKLARSAAALLLSLCACLLFYAHFRLESGFLLTARRDLADIDRATDAELDELDEAPGITPKSRLGCQTVPDGTTDIVVEIPDWNKSYARELDH